MFYSTFQRLFKCAKPLQFIQEVQEGDFITTKSQILDHDNPGKTHKPYIIKAFDTKTAFDIVLFVIDLNI